MSIRTQPKRPLKKIIPALLGLLGIAVCALTYMFWNESQFESKYRSFIEVEYQFETAAFKPGMESNPIRQQVSILLAQVIQGEMSAGERLDKSRQGIAHLNDIEAQIDGIKAVGDTVAPLRSDLQERARSVTSVRNRAKTLELVSLAARQAEIISDIRGLSYRTDYYTNEVFERVIDDQGVMTDAHKQYLNDLIPQLEEQFDRRTNLYTELADNAEIMKEIGDGLGYGAR